MLMLLFTEFKPVFPANIHRVRMGCLWERKTWTEMAATPGGGN